MVTRDILKSGVNLPLFGAISLGGIVLVGALVYFVTRRRGKTITLN